MKLILVLILTVFSVSSFSAETDASKRALNLLMNRNPIAYNENLPSQRVNSLISHMMTSSFQTSNDGVLSVVLNDCEKKTWTYSCRLILESSDRLIDTDGSFLKSDGSYTTKVIIDYNVDKYFKIIFKAVNYSIEQNIE